MKTSPTSKPNTHQRSRLDWPLGISAQAVPSKRRIIGPAASTLRPPTIQKSLALVPQTASSEAVSSALTSCQLASVGTTASSSPHATSRHRERRWPLKLEQFY